MVPFTLQDQESKAPGIFMAIRGWKLGCNLEIGTYGDYYDLRAIPMLSVRRGQRAFECMRMNNSTQILNKRYIYMEALLDLVCLLFSSLFFIRRKCECSHGSTSSSIGHWKWMSPILLEAAGSSSHYSVLWNSLMAADYRASLMLPSKKKVWADACVSIASSPDCANFFHAEESLLMKLNFFWATITINHSCEFKKRTANVAEDAHFYQVWLYFEHVSFRIIWLFHMSV